MPRYRVTYIYEEETEADDADELEEEALYAANNFARENLLTVVDVEVEEIA